MIDLRYPTGKFQYKETSDEVIQAAIKEIAIFPKNLSDYLNNTSAKAWITPYREGGWNASQVLHHLVDSHVNAYCRMKLALVDPGSSLRAYEEADWSTLNEADGSNYEDSVMLLTALHARMISLLKQVKSNQLENALLHPETGKMMSLSKLIQMYAWHGKHHLAHIQISFGDLK